MNTEHKLPRAAVVIIAHNDEAHIRRAIESVCHQTERNIEIICVDDGSTDGTYGIMCRCGEEDRRIRAITQPNSGALGARNAGLRQVTAGCVLFLDSDDVFVPEAVDTACRAMDATGADVVEFGVRLVKAKDNPPTQDTWTFLSRYFSQEKPLPDTDHGPELARACFVGRAITWNIWNKLYRTETLQKAFQFYRGEWVCLEEDMLLTLMVLCLARHYERISEKLYVYTVGAGISTAAAKLTDPDAVKKAATEGLVLKLAREWLQKLGCTGEEVGLDALTEFVENGILLHIVNRVAAEKRSEYLKMLWQYSDADVYFDLLSRAISGQQREIEQMREQVARLAEENCRAGAAAETQRQQTVLLEQENQRLRESFDTISNAKLWKMTKPLRAVLDFVKGGGEESNLRLFVRSLRVYGIRATAEKTVRYLQRRAYDKKLAAQEQGREAAAPLQTMEDLADMRLGAACPVSLDGTKEVFGQRMESIYRSLTAKEPLPVEATVSVIIPTFNGGNDLPGLLTLLADQVDVREMEIVVVDSGSTDNTRAIAADFGAKIIEISQAEFSHSFARNLGAEHASGEYLLFMTQDAKPGSLHWVRDMAQPLVRDDAVAVSCREEPRDDCDLLGRYSIWIHSKYMGILGRDRILSLPANESWDAMRKNAQLNDVACMIRRDVFRAFAYRGNYAEDLDLGLRLIKKGYRLALLSSAPVIHSHNRTAYYHLKRCLVDATTLPRLLPGLPVERISADTAVNRILGMTAAVWHYVTALAEAQDVPTQRKAFFAWSARFFDGEAKRLRALDYGDLGPILAAKPPCCDRQFYDFVQDLYSHGERAFRVNTDWLDTRRNHVLAELENYLAYTDEPFTGETIGQIGELFVKQCGQAAGETLSAYLQSRGQEASFLHDWTEELQRGV